ncbi:MAG: archaetidylserine decarboxylase [Betaproteobacteria bacterium]|nr:archaetidylserine decarboxylase [Betaproteobacteria bacterium]MCH9849321.1 archaetidylserine decarboxylase [Betaproteobacteria bacterium]
MKFTILLQQIAPKQLITIVAGKLANLQYPALTPKVIDWFVKRYQVNMQEAENPEISSYKTFNDFFTRPLKNGARPIATADFICPVDGAISQFGEIRQNQIFQAKGHDYSTLALVAGNAPLANHFEDGHFACLYLSPKDYHRIHMPCDGKLISMTYVPGDLFSVNPTTAENVPNLFARNERVVCEFISEKHGTFVMVLVGATIVGSMATVWHGVINPPRSKTVEEWQYNQQDISLKQGEEMGRFMLGSTVVMLFQKDALSFNPNWQPAQFIQLGEVMGKATAS